MIKKVLKVVFIGIAVIVGAWIGLVVLAMGFATIVGDGDATAEDTTPEDTQQETEWVTPTADDIPVRMGPGEEHDRPLVTAMERGDRYEALQDSIGWTQIKDRSSGTSMWASSEDLEPFENYRSEIETATERRINEYGQRPEASAWDGSYREVERHLQKVAHNPDAVEITGCTEVYHHEDGWLVGCNWRGENAFGAIRQQSNWFTIKHGIVIEMHEGDAFNPN